jgi:hypothetical protein
LPRITQLVTGRAGVRSVIPDSNAGAFILQMRENSGATS